MAHEGRQREMRGDHSSQGGCSFILCHWTPIQTLEGLHTPNDIWTEGGQLNREKGLLITAITSMHALSMITYYGYHRYACIINDYLLQLSPVCMHYQWLLITAITSMHALSMITYYSYHQSACIINDYLLRLSPVCMRYQWLLITAFTSMHALSMITDYSFPQSACIINDYLLQL